MNMFAVTGWSLPAAPVAQTKTPVHVVEKRGRKRKRKHQKESQTELDLSDEKSTLKEKESPKDDSNADVKRSKTIKHEFRPTGHADEEENPAEDGPPSKNVSQSSRDPKIDRDREASNFEKSKDGRDFILSKLHRVNQSLANDPGRDGTMKAKKSLRLKKTKERLERQLQEIDTEFSASAVPLPKGASATSSKVPASNAPKSSSIQSAPNHQSSNISFVDDTKLTPMQISMRTKLASARFRHLNEQLYTSPSAVVQKLFQEDPQMFEDYHIGFRQQVENWPENPVEGFIDDVRKRIDGRIARRGPEAQEEAVPLPRTKGICTIADLGAGEGRLALGLKELSIGMGKEKATGKTLKGNVRVMSYDLVGKGDIVIAADMADLPLKDGSVDVAIFCLALMGTNWLDFVDEAWRILKVKGELWVAEIKSRFGRVEKAKGKPIKHSVGNRRKGREQEEENDIEFIEVDENDEKKDQTDVFAFLEVLRKRGFAPDQRGDRSVDSSNKMFVKMKFVKAGAPVRGKHAEFDSKRPTVEKGVVKKGGNWLDDRMDDEIDEGQVLKPCVYKLR